MNLDLPTRVVGDVAAGATVVGSLMGFLPVAAAIVGIIWYTIQIWETKTVQALVAKWRVSNDKDPDSA